MNVSKLALSVLVSLSPLWAFAEEDELPAIFVESTELSDVSAEQVKSADLAEALTRNVPGISLIRRSGIANDVILRGQNKDNINVLMDNTKTYGAGPNRMDPPIAHILSNNVESIDVIEGPYDVLNFGTLSGVIKVKTKKPEKDLHAELNLNFGRWNYQKQAISASGGNDTVRALVSISKEKGDQYEDGDGNIFAEQIDNLNLSGLATGLQYKNEYRDREAYEKKTFMGKLDFDIMEDHEASISYTANRSDDILYPSSKMDAIYDDSNIFNLEYTIKNINDFSKKLEFQYYHSDVVHPMSNKYRNSSGPNSRNEMISKLTTDMDGFKVQNSFDIDPSMTSIIGLDFSQRNWDGQYKGKGMMSGVTGRPNIENVDTNDGALFAELNKQYNDFNIKMGIRYDDVSVRPGGQNRNNDYNYFSGFANTTYQFNDVSNLFVGVGKSSRVPDARELYFKGSNGMQIGTPDLDKIDNYEIDLGFEQNYEQLTIKTTFFHSWFKNYIHYNASKLMNRQENIDAKLYGFNISGFYSFTDEVYLDFGLAYQRGKKDKALPGQTDRDLANVTPAKLNLGLNYDYMENGSAKIEVVAADSWDNYDADNGEQQISGYGVMNLTLRHELNRYFEFTVGIDNLFDKTYAVNNTYQDLTLITDGFGDIMKMNEPGRYYYVNAKIKY